MTLSHFKVEHVLSSDWIILNTVEVWHKFLSFFLHYEIVASLFCDYFQKKCEMYWPMDESSPLSFRDITVSMTSYVEWADFVIRVLEVSKVRG